MRTIIELPADQLAALEALCRRDGISRAEAIRRAVGALVRQESAITRRRAFGLWRARRVPGDAYQERARREWDAAPASRGRAPGARPRRRR
jgi:hypothetical protein